MKVVYKGHTIEVTREKCLGGWPMLYTSVFRISDGLECVCAAEETADTVKSQIQDMKERIDEELERDDPWDEEELFESEDIILFRGDEYEI